MFPGIFLDRDGVIIEHRAGYVCTWKDVEIYPQALRALRRIKSSGFRIAIVTNQSAIGRELVSYESVSEINQRLIKQINDAGGRIDGLYLCPHVPEDGCACRKPQPGLIQQAAFELDIDLNQSILIGDNLTDLQAGQTAGIAQLALVCTGLGYTFLNESHSDVFPRHQVFKDLENALNYLIPMDNTGGNV